MAELPEAFYLPNGNALQASEITIGPWSADFQHAGPPAALLAREVEQLLGDTDLRVARIQFNIQRPVPVAALTVKAELRPGGRRVRYAQAELLDAHGRVLVSAEALLIRQAEVNVPEPSAQSDASPPTPDDSKDFEFPFFLTDQGYHKGMQLQFAEGEFGSGRATAWFRMRRPLVADEAPTPLQRVVIAADSGNGISQCMNPREYGFVNPDLFVVLHREPVGEWVALRAQTFPGADGIGMAESQLLDLQGPIGRSVQTLMLESLHAGKDR